MVSGVSGNFSYGASNFRLGSNPEQELQDFMKQTGLNREEAIQQLEQIHSGSPEKTANIFSGQGNNTNFEIGRIDYANLSPDMFDTNDDKTGGQGGFLQGIKDFFGGFRNQDGPQKEGDFDPTCEAPQGIPQGMPGMPFPPQGPMGQQGPTQEGDPNPFGGKSFIA